MNVWEDNAAERTRRTHTPNAATRQLGDRARRAASSIDALILDVFRLSQVGYDDADDTIRAGRLLARAYALAITATRLLTNTARPEDRAYADYILARPPRPTDQETRT